MRDIAPKESKVPVVGFNKIKTTVVLREGMMPGDRKARSLSEESSICLIVSDD